MAQKCAQDLLAVLAVDSAPFPHTMLVHYARHLKERD